MLQMYISLCCFFCFSTDVTLVSKDKPPPFFQKWFEECGVAKEKIMKILRSSNFIAQRMKVYMDSSVGCDVPLNDIVDYLLPTKAIQDLKGGGLTFREAKRSLHAAEARMGCRLISTRRRFNRIRNQHFTN